MTNYQIFSCFYNGQLLSRRASCLCKEASKRYQVDMLCNSFTKTVFGTFIQTLEDDLAAALASLSFCNLTRLFNVAILKFSLPFEQDLPVASDKDFLVHAIRPNDLFYKYFQ